MMKKKISRKRSSSNKTHMSQSEKFVGRTELLDWLNDTLHLQYSKIEDCANGAAFCQLIDMVHPSTVPLQRVNFNASLAHESMENLKILQDVFVKNGITAVVDVGSLAKGRYTAALNVLQFLYGYIKTHPIVKGYDPVARRKLFHLSEPGKPKRKAANKGVPVLDKSMSLKKNSSLLRHSIESAASSSIEVEKMAQKAEEDKATIADLKKKLAEANRQMASMKDDYEMMTQERDFYYEKLRKVEEFCQDHEEELAYVKIIDILYETDRARGFVPPDEAELNEQKEKERIEKDIAEGKQYNFDEYSFDENTKDDHPDDFEQEAELPDILKSPPNKD